MLLRNGTRKVTVHYTRLVTFEEIEENCLTRDVMTDFHYS